MSGINKIILVGRTGKDPETRYLQDGKAVSNFSIATSEEWKDKNTDEKKEKTQWHNCVAWGKLGEIVGKYLSKGRQCYVEGKIEYEEYEKDGIKRYSTKIVAEKVEFLGSKNEGQAPQQHGRPQAPQGDYQQPPANAGNYNQQPYPPPVIDYAPPGMQQPEAQTEEETTWKQS